MTRPSDLDLWRQQLADAIARNSQGHPAAAQRAFSKLLRAILASGDTRPEVLLVRSRAHLGLATSTFDQRGDVGAALQHIDAAEAVARDAGAPHVLVAVLGQRGLLYLGSGETTAALLAFDSAADLLDQAEPFDQMPDDPERSGIFEDAPGGGQPRTGKGIVLGKRLKLVPRIGDGVHFGHVGPPQIAAELHIVGRVGKD